MNRLEFSMSLASSNLIDYFVDSNTAGKIVIVFLGVMNCYALSLMWTKYQDLKRAIEITQGMKRESMILLPYMTMMMHFSGEGSPYLAICSRAMEAARRTKAVGQVRMNSRENAIRRALAEVGDRYESKMYWLATMFLELLFSVSLARFGV